jgi:hypothetical protein
MAWLLIVSRRSVCVPYMGAGAENRTPLAWQGTLAQMRGHGTRVAQSCSEPTCRAWVLHDVDALARDFGDEHMLWGRRPPCRHCGGATHYLASPGPSTPYRPLLSGAVADALRRAFLKSFGFTRRDVRRIQAMAEAVEPNYAPASLDDLDVPYRVGACWPGQENRTTGKYLGEWKGRTLLFWEMNEPEADRWRRKRARGPKPVPGRPR